MSDREALKIFSRQPVNNDMINYLVSTTNAIIQIKPSKVQVNNIRPLGKNNISLLSFIKNLIRYSNVQTPTLMATLIYLNKLRNLLPANAIGMETTRHRIFLSALILSAKSLNDSSPLNKHWTKYTDGLLNIDEVNMAERELINLLNWNVNIYEEDLIIALQPFLIPIKSKLSKKLSIENNKKINYYRNSVANLSNYSLQSTTSTSSNYSNLSLNSPNYIYTQPNKRSYSNSSISSISSPNSLKSSNSNNSISSNSTNNSDYKLPINITYKKNLLHKLSA